MTESEIIDKLKGMITSERLNHSIGVRDTALRLAEFYGCDTEKAVIAGLLHDCAKNIDKQRMLQMCDNFDIVLDDISRIELKLVHAPLGAKLAEKEFGIHDPEILDAICYHTVAKKKMSLLTKIIYLADFIEPSRDFPEVNELRKISFEDLNAGVLFAIDRTIRYVLTKGRIIHPRTVEARNYILLFESKQVFIR